MWYPSIEFILLVYHEQIGGILRPLINLKGLKGTLDKMRFGIPYHANPTIWEKSTIFFKDVVENHYFVDGNKRIGILIASLFLNLNGFHFKPPQGEIFSVTMDVAQDKTDFDELKHWFEMHSNSI